MKSYYELLEFLQLKYRAHGKSPPLECLETLPFAKHIPFVLSRDYREGAGSRMRARDTVSYLAYLVLHARSVAPIRLQGEPLVFDENGKAADQKNC